MGAGDSRGVRLLLPSVDALASLVHDNRFAGLTPANCIVEELEDGLVDHSVGDVPVGTILTSVTGVVHYAWSSYEIHPRTTEDLDYQRALSPPPSPPPSACLCSCRNSEVIINYSAVARTQDTSTADGSRLSSHARLARELSRGCGLTRDGSLADPRASGSALPLSSLVGRCDLRPRTPYGTRGSPYSLFTYVRPLEPLMLAVERAKRGV